jgi:hypothetical protein
MVVALMVVLCAAPARAEGESLGRSAFQRWLNGGDGDRPFRYYGFAEACSKYFAHVVLGRPADSADVTRIVRHVDRSEARAGLAREVADIELKLRDYPRKIAELEQHLSEIRPERDALARRLDEQQAQLKAATEAIGGVVAETSRAWDKRTQILREIEVVRRRLELVQHEMTRTEMERIKLMQTRTQELERQLGARRDALARLETPEVDLEFDHFMVSPRPLLLASLPFAALALVGGVALRRRSLLLPFQLLFTGGLALLGYFYLTLAAAASYRAPGLLANPRGLGLGVAVLLIAGLAERRGRCAKTGAGGSH